MAEGSESDNKRVQNGIRQSLITEINSMSWTSPHPARGYDSWRGIWVSHDDNEVVVRTSFRHSWHTDFLHFVCSFKWCQILSGLKIASCQTAYIKKLPKVISYDFIRLSFSKTIFQSFFANISQKFCWKQ